MRTTLTLLSLLVASSLAAQNLDKTPYGIADCSGQGAGVVCLFEDYNGILVPGTDFTLVAYYQGVDPDTVFTTTATAFMSISDSVPLPAIHWDPIVLDSCHRISAFFTAYVLGMPSPQQMNIYVDFVPMQCEFTEACYGNTLVTTGGDGIWMDDMGNTLLVGDSLSVSSPMVISLYPSALLINHYDDWVPDQQFVEPEIWVEVTTIPENCDWMDGVAAAYATGTAPYSYLWDTGDTTLAILGVASGLYFVHVTDVLGCEFTSYGVVEDTCDISTAISEEGNTQMSLYPNPAETVLSIEGLEVGTNIFIYNTFGALVEEARVTGVKTNLDVSSYAEGWYQVRMEHKGQVQTKPLAIVR